MWGRRGEEISKGGKGTEGGGKGAHHGARPRSDGHRFMCVGREGGGVPKEGEGRRGKGGKHITVRGQERTDSECHVCEVVCVFVQDRECV